MAYEAIDTFVRNALSDYLENARLNSLCFQSREELAESFRDGIGPAFQKESKHVFFGFNAEGCRRFVQEHCDFLSKFISAARNEGLGAFTENAPKFMERYIEFIAPYWADFFMGDSEILLIITEGPFQMNCVNEYVFQTELEKAGPFTESIMQYVIDCAMVPLDEEV